MIKQVIYSSETDLENILNGAYEAYNIITKTMGPDGKLITLIEENMRFRETKDGATVAKNFIGTGDDVHKYGAKLLTDASVAMANKIGDGSTTVVLLTYHILKSILKWRKIGVSSNIINKALDFVNNFIKTTIKDIATPLDTNSDYVTKIATVASGDEEVGRNISELFKKLGHEAMIIVDDSKQECDTIKYEEGYFFEKGYESPAFPKPNTDEHAKGKIELNDPYVLLYDKSIQSLTPMLELFQKISQQGKPLLILAESFDGDVIRSLVYNRVLHNVLNCVCVKLPGYGEGIRDYLLDIATITGAEPHLYENNQSVEANVITSLGRAKKIIITNESTTILNGYGPEHQIQNRINEIQNKVVNANQYTAEKLLERISKLRSGIGKYNVGGKDDHAVKEKKDRVEDAINACKNALKQGIVPGAGSEFLWVSKVLEKFTPTNQAEEIGISILRDILPEVTSKIINNGDKTDASVIIYKILEEMRNNNNHRIGYNPLSETLTSDLLQVGIVNPALVSIKGIEIATEVGKRFSKIDALVINQPKSDAKSSHNLPFHG